MTMKPPDDEAIFRIACRISSADLRADYLDQACRGDQLLRDRVDTLLRHHDHKDDFLELPAGGIAATIEFLPISEHPGTTSVPTS